MFVSLYPLPLEIFLYLLIIDLNNKRVKILLLSYFRKKSICKMMIVELEAP